MCSVSRRNTLDHIHLDEDNGQTPLVSDQLNAQAASLKHKLVGLPTETFDDDVNEIPIRLWEASLTTILRLVGTGDCTRDLPNVRPVCYHGDTSLSK